MCKSGVYQLDPALNQQTRWPTVVCNEDGLFISAEETGIFTIYLFLTEEDALNAPEVLYPPQQ